MTSTTGTTQHPDVTEISDLAEGLLPPPRAAEVRGHVDGCEPCGEVRASLTEIRELLGSVPAPQRMPDDIAARIDAVLAAEAGHVSRETGSVSRETETPSADAETPAAQRPKGETGSPDRPAGHPRATTGPGRRPVRRRRRAALGAALGAAVVGVSVFMLQSVQPSPGSSSVKAADHRTGPGTTGEGDFSESTLEGRVRSLLRNADTKQPKSAEGTGSGKQAPSADSRTKAQTPLRTPTVSVPPCVERGTGRDAPALALEEGTYEGTAAFLVVLPHPSDASRVQAYVVDASCVRDEPTRRGTLLLTHTYTRP
ncbi:anti-sigma factor family protein [Streptomyces sp. NPDC057499]|uniref:anti-sigma factor family protein n=1 Tax=Streptomyces sp. NPDC057499 TaxID=3346150 RepID=UPI003674B7F9